jgi:predicted ATP-grasp superfamily ATP-dependent carboligase
MINSDPNNYSVPALVLGSGLTALATIRCLGVSGIPSYCISDRCDFEAASRWHRRLPPKFGTISDSSQLSGFLERLPFEKAVLIPCSDPWTLAAACLQDPLKDRFLISQSDLEVQRSFVDKGRFQSLLQRHSIPHPRTYSLENEESLNKLLERLPAAEVPHYFLKPRESMIFSRHFKKKGFSLANPQDAIKKFRIAREAGFEMLLQEYVLGPPSNHYYVEGLIDRNGKVRSVFARRRLRMYPLNFGNSSMFMSIPVEAIEPAVEIIKTLLAESRYRGIYSAEFKRDELDGIYKLLEINARCWWYVEFLQRCGVNIPEMAYRDALGLEVKEVLEYNVGARAAETFLDICAFIKENLAGRLSLWEWLKSWKGAQFTVLCWRDPLPAVADIYYKVRRLFRRMLGRR